MARSARRAARAGRRDRASSSGAYGPAASSASSSSGARPAWYVALHCSPSRSPTASAGPSPSPTASVFVATLAVPVCATGSGPSTRSSGGPRCTRRSRSCSSPVTWWSPRSGPGRLRPGRLRGRRRGRRAGVHPGPARAAAAGGPAVLRPAQRAVPGAGRSRAAAGRGRASRRRAARVVEAVATSLRLPYVARSGPGRRDARRHGTPGGTVSTVAAGVPERAGSGPGRGPAAGRGGFDSVTPRCLDDLARQAGLAVRAEASPPSCSSPGSGSSPPGRRNAAGCAATCTTGSGRC